MGTRSRFTGPARVVRGLVLGAVVLLLTAVAHTSGDRSSPSIALGSLAWLLPLAVGLSVVAADRRRSRAWLLAYLFGVQALLHVMLVVNAGHASHRGSVVPSPAMIAMHSLAVGAAAVVITHADEMLHRWLAFVDCLTCDYRLSAVRVPVALGDGLSQLAVVVRPHGELVDMTLQRRGPPRAAFA